MTKGENVPLSLGIVPLPLPVKNRAVANGSKPFGLTGAGSARCSVSCLSCGAIYFLTFCL